LNIIFQLLLILKMIDIIHNYFTNETLSQVIKVIETKPWSLFKKMNKNSQNEHQFHFLQEYKEDKD